MRRLRKKSFKNSLRQNRSFFLSSFRLMRKLFVSWVRKLVFDFELAHNNYLKEALGCE